MKKGQRWSESAKEDSADSIIIICARMITVVETIVVVVVAVIPIVEVVKSRPLVLRTWLFDARRRQ